VKGIEPEHGAIEFTLPRRTTEWSAIVWRTIQVPRLKFVGMLRWREQTESCRYAALPNFRRTGSRGHCWSWRKWNANRWLRTFGASAQALF
jgi:hypothetical protein